MTVEQFFNALYEGAIVVMVFTLVMSLGMSFTVGQIVAPMRRFGFLLGAIVVNILLAPLVAIGVCSLLPLSSEARVGLEVVVIAAAGPAGLKACQLAKRADMAMAVSFTIVLQLVNIVAAPLWAKAVVSGATVDSWTIVKDLLLLVLIPLVLGLVGRARYTEHADAWKASLEKVSNIALFIGIGVGIAVNWTLMVSLIGSWVIVASVMIIVIYVVLGWAAGFRHQQTAVTISMITSMRFTPIGLIVIATVLGNQGAYLVPALIFALVDTVVPFLIAVEIGRLGAAREKTAATVAGGSQQA